MSPAFENGAGDFGLQSVFLFYNFLKMERAEFLEKFKDLLGAGDTAAAIAFLKSEKMPALDLKTLTLIEADFNAVRQSELKGLIDFQEARLKYNQINERLISLAEAGDPAVLNSKNKSRRNWILVALIPVLAAVFWFVFFQKNDGCPDFETGKKNKILILPFENVGSEPARPELILRNRINELTSKNNLSASAKLLSTETKVASTDSEKSLQLAKNCAVDLVVWGQYSSRADSIRLVMQYYFLKEESLPASESLALKDVTGLQSGKMLKSLDDAIFSLCGIMALREGDKALTQKWVDKVKEKDATDLAMMQWAGE